MKLPRSLLAAVLLGAAPLPLMGAEKTPAEALGRYIPADAFLFLGKAHTPERAFVDAHWSRVYAALAASGIDRELHSAISSSLDEQDRAKFDETWTTLMRLFKGVAWRDLVANELVFAERITGLFPNWFFFCRPKQATLEENVRGLSEIFRTLASFDQDGDVEFTVRTERGVDIWSIDFRKAPVGVCLLRKGDVVGIVIGKPGRHDCIALLSGDESASSILDNPRYRAALAQVPTPQHFVGFVDLSKLNDVLRRIPAMAMGEAAKRRPAETEEDPLAAAHREHAKAQADAWLDVVGALVDMLDILDYVAISGRMEGEQEYAYTVTKVKTSALDKPLYRTIAHQRPVESFHRYLPVETTSFLVSSFVDPEALYGVIMDFIRTKIPDGARACDKWDQIQKEIGFNLQEDLLSWLGGEFVVFALPRKTPSPFGGDNGVALLRVKDREKARAKLSAGLERLVTLAAEYGQPLQVTPASTISVEGFQRINHPFTAAMMVQPCIGIWEDWLIIGDSEYSVQTCIETAAGKHDSIVKNPRFRAEGLAADGEAVYAASFSDLSRVGEQLTAAFIAAGFVGASMPENPETRPIKAVIRTLGSLGPVVNEINFFSSKSTTTTFADNTWRSTTKITYQPARAASAQTDP